MNITHYFQRALPVIIAVVSVLAFCTLVISSASAETSKEALCQGVGLSGTSTNCQPKDGQPTVDSTIEDVINIISILVGVISVIMIMIGGLKYVTSAGDSSKVSSAKDTILYAVIGLVVVALSQIIVQFVISRT